MHGNYIIVNISVFKFVTLFQADDEMDRGDQRLHGNYIIVSISLFKFVILFQANDEMDRKVEDYMVTALLL